MNADTSRYSAEELAKRGSLGYRGEKAYLAERWKKEGWDEDQINLVLAGAKTPTEQGQILQKTLMSLKGEYTAKDTEGKYYRHYTPEDDEKWLADQLGAVDRAVSQYENQKKVGTALERN